MQWLQKVIVVLFSPRNERHMLQVLRCSLTVPRAWTGSCVPGPSGHPSTEGRRHDSATRADPRQHLRLQGLVRRICLLLASLGKALAHHANGPAPDFHTHATSHVTGLAMLLGALSARQPPAKSTHQAQSIWVRTTPIAGEGDRPVIHTAGFQLIPERLEPSLLPLPRSLYTIVASTRRRWTADPNIQSHVAR